MSDRTFESDDLSITQEYVIAGIVILLFGLLYWFFNHGLSNPFSQGATGINSPFTTQTALQGSSTGTSSQSPYRQSLIEQQGSETIDTKSTGSTVSQSQQSGQADAGVEKTAIAQPKEQSLQAGHTQNSTELTASTRLLDPAVAKFRGHLLEGKLELPIVLETVGFAENSDDMELSSAQQINDLALVMEEHPEAQVLIRGHAKAVGTAEETKELSLMRANKLGWALSNAGVAGERIIIMGMGDQEIGNKNNGQVDVSVTQE